MIFWGFVILYGTYNSHPVAPPYVPPPGRYVAENIGLQRILAKMGRKFTPIFQYWVVYCNQRLYVLPAVPRNVKHLYRLSIHGSIDFGPCVYLSICGTSFWSTRKWPKFGSFCQYGQKRSFLPIFEHISARNIFVTTSRMKTLQV